MKNRLRGKTTGLETTRQINITLTPIIPVSSLHGFISVALSGLLISLFSNLALSEESVTDSSAQTITLNTANEERILEEAFEKLKRLMLNAKNVKVFANPQRKPASKQANRCQAVADKLLKGQVNSIATLPYESSTQFTDLSKNISGKLTFLEEVGSKYERCSENVFTQKYMNDFRTSLDDPIDKEDPRSYRLIKQKNILLLLDISHRAHEESIHDITALYTSPYNGFLTGYVNGEKIEEPDCADDFISLHSWREPKDFVISFPMDDILIAAYFKEPVIIDEKKNANDREHPKLLLNWVPNQPSKSILALVFLDNPKNYIEKYQGGLIKTLDDSDCILTFQPNTPTDGDNL